MKTNIRNLASRYLKRKSKLTALLVTLSGLVALSLKAAPLVVNGTAHPAESGAAYTGVSNTAALHVINPGASYSGTNITLSTSIDGLSTNHGKEALYVSDQASVSLFGGTITSTGARGTAGWITRASSVILNDVTIVNTGTNTGRVLYVSDTSTVLLDRVNITSTQGGSGVILTFSSTVNVANSTINTVNRGLDVGSLAVLTATNVVVRTTSNTNGAALHVSNAAAFIYDSEFISENYMGAMVNGSGMAEIYNSTISGSRSALVIQTDGNVTVHDSYLFGTNNAVEFSHSGTWGDSRLAVNGGTIASNGNLIAENPAATEACSAVVEFNNVDISKAGGIVIDKESVIEVAVNGGSGIVGDLTNSGSGTLTVSFTSSSLTGASDAGPDATLAVSLDNSMWDVTGDSTLTRLNVSNGGQVSFNNGGAFKNVTTRDLTGSGVFVMNTDIAANAGDKLHVTGSGNGAHQITVRNKNTASITGGEPALLLVDASAATGDASFSGQFSGATSIAMFDYEVKNGDQIGGTRNNWYLALSGSTPVNPPRPGSVGQDLLADLPSQSASWFANIDNVSAHLSDLRGNDSARKLDGGILDSVWLKSYGAQLNVSPGVVGRGYKEYNYGVAAGADKRCQLDAANDLIAGAYAGYSAADRDLHNDRGSLGGLNGYGLGLYAVWLHESGLFADLITSAQYVDHDIRARAADGGRTNADYHNWAAGATLDIGKKFAFKDDWFIQPTLTVSYAHFTGSDYTTDGDNVFDASISAQNVVQFAVSTRFGRSIKLGKHGLLQPYVKVGGVEQISSGGEFRYHTSSWRPTLDGARAEIGAGLIWKLNAAHHLSLDYEASFGDKFDKPWGLTAGYRYQF
ncbi:MAG: autotransporter outer membrane beta-barrel domain-containing protein [Verrucomicrobiales bacterium]|nr:autotransporter outer membrane beta-barrel domain-containing protein [Verrucomicrobiales bacterium]